MKLKSLISTALVCILLMSLLAVPAQAAQIPGTTVTETHSVVNQDAEVPVYPKDVIEEPVFINEIPRYDQTDYPNIPYSQGSIATSGCGITCLAMVATYLLNEEHLPDECGLAYNKTAYDNGTRMENGIRDLGLAWLGKVYTKADTIAALEEGKVLIALVDDTSIFTNYGHFIVLTGINEDGKYTVNDPNGYNWNRYADGFENGFEEWQIFHGYCGAWVFDKNLQSIATAHKEELQNGVPFVDILNKLFEPIADVAVDPIN